MDLLQHKRHLLLFVVFYLCLYYIIFFIHFDSFNQFSDIVELLGQSTALPLYLYCIHKHPRGKRLPWILFFICALTYMVGDIIWSYHYHVYGSEPQVPSICDLFYIFNSILYFLLF